MGNKCDVSRNKGHQTCLDSVGLDQPVILKAALFTFP